MAEILSNLSEIVLWLSRALMLASLLLLWHSYRLYRNISHWSIGKTAGVVSLIIAICFSVPWAGDEAWKNWIPLVTAMVAGLGLGFGLFLYERARGNLEILKQIKRDTPYALAKKSASHLQEANSALRDALEAPWKFKHRRWVWALVFVIIIIQVAALAVGGNS